MYSPTLTRFTSRDPMPGPGEPMVLYDNNWIGDRLTMMRNMYAYTDNNPVNRDDPSGLDWDKCSLSFVQCKNKGKASESLICHFRCFCPDKCDDKGIEVVLRFRGCQRPSELDEQECIRHSKSVIKQGDCKGKGGTAPSD